MVCQLQHAGVTISVEDPLSVCVDNSRAKRSIVHSIALMAPLLCHLSCILHLCQLRKRKRTDLPLGHAVRTCQLSCSFALDLDSHI